MEKQITKELTQRKKELIEINSVSSYLAMFPVDVPLELIQKYSKENDLVMDNFSGRGTTAISSRFLNRRFVGNDLNPYSFVLSKFKISKLSKSRLLLFVDKLEKEYLTYTNTEINDDNEMLIYYSKYTLKQLLFLREKLGKNWKKNGIYANAVLAFSLGLMHGKAMKTGETNFFSVSMSNVISMSPNYVSNYKKLNNLECPEVNVFEKIKDRIKKKFHCLLTNSYESTFRYYDSLKSFNFINDNSVDLVITSHPYLSVVDYTKSNWIKLWLLGFQRKELSEKIKLKDKLKLEEYIEFIKTYLNNIHSKLKPNAKVCLIVGDVHGTSLIEDTWERIQRDVKYQKVDLIIQELNENQKTLRSMNTRKGNATKTEKILILERKWWCKKRKMLKL